MPSTFRMTSCLCVDDNAIVFVTDSFFVICRCCYIRLKKSRSNPIKSPAPSFVASRSRPHQIVPEFEEKLKNNERNVLFVAASDAKALKVALENCGCLDKTYRMTKASDSATIENPKRPHIAVPVTAEGLDKMYQGDVAWSTLVVGSGKQEMPLSTSVMARKKKQR